MMSDAVVVSPLLRRYASDAEMFKHDKEMRNFKYGSFTQRNFFRKLRDRNSRCGFVYNEQNLPWVFVKRIDLSIRGAMCSGGQDHRETTLKYLAF